MQQKETVPLKRLLERKYVEILCYPRYDPKEAQKRLRELEKLGVKALEFVGGKKAFDVYVLGKGYVGVVVVAHTSMGRAALKIRRLDADRAGMQHEVEMLKKANDVDVGPKLLDATGNFLLMEFIEGKQLPDWIEARRQRRTQAEIRRVLREILEQCWRLDRVGLDHGELSQAPKHILVDANNVPHILDFETASIHRKVSNVTSVCQYLFIGSQLARIIKEKLGEVDTESLIGVLKAYKLKRTRENFEKVLDACGLRSWIGSF